MRVHTSTRRPSTSVPIDSPCSWSFLLFAFIVIQFAIEKAQAVLEDMQAVVLHYLHIGHDTAVLVP